LAIVIFHDGQKQFTVSSNQVMQKPSPNCHDIKKKLGSQLYKLIERYRDVWVGFV